MKHVMERFFRVATLTGTHMNVTNMIKKLSIMARGTREERLMLVFAYVYIQPYTQLIQSAVSVI